MEDGVGTDLESVGMCQQSSGQSSPYGMLRLTNMLTLLDFIAGRPGVGKLSILVTLSESFLLYTSLRSKSIESQLIEGLTFLFICC